MASSDGGARPAGGPREPGAMRRGAARFWRCLVASGALHASLLLAAFAIPVVSLRGPGKAVKEARLEVDESTPQPTLDLPEEPLEEIVAEELLPDPELMPVDLPREDPSPELPVLYERPPDELVVPELPLRFPERVLVELALEPELQPEEPAPIVEASEPQRVEPALDPAVNVKPRYPTLARRLGLEGTVRLLLHVGTDGAVTSVRILRSSGHEILDEAAVRAVETWILQPGTLAGVPVEMDVEHEVVFTLQD